MTQQTSVAAEISRAIHVISDLAQQSLEQTLDAAARAIKCRVYRPRRIICPSSFGSRACNVNIKRIYLMSYWIL